MRAIGQTFRPEFQNRLDKVIVFRPLTRDLMRGILKKELNRVLERRGLKDREWAVEWEASALEFLLEKGFSPEMGARPLKRAIDQYVIAPLAATIVEQRFPEGDQFVFVRSDGRAIQAEFVDPDADAAGASPRRPPGARRAAGAAGDDAGARAAPTPSSTRFEGEHAGPSSATLASRGMGGAQGAPLRRRWRRADFWTRPDRHETLARLALMDRVKAAAETARVAARRGSPRAPSAPASPRASWSRGWRCSCTWSRRASATSFEGGADRGGARGRAGLRASRATARRRAPGAGSCSTCTAPGPSNRHMQLTEIAGDSAARSCRCC